MPKRKSLPTSLIVAVVCAALMSASCGKKENKHDAVGRIKEALPIGSSKAQVIAFLDSLEVNGHKATRGEYITPYKDANPKVKGYLGGCLCDDERGWFEWPCVCMMFYFDESEKLLTYQVDDFDKR